MPPNTHPIYPLTPRIGRGTVKTANTAKDGTGTVVTVFTAGPNDSRVDRIRVIPTGTTGGATVLRIFYNNGSDATVATNNSLWYELTIPSATLSETAAQTAVEILPKLVIPAGSKLNVTVGTTVSVDLAVTVEGGDY